MTRVFALVDGNSFYCSCERLFRPELANRPVIVLSNNDGCAVARTAEAKALGIAMGAPYHQIRDLCRREGVVAFSSNYALYGDVSRRMNEVYHRFAPEVEVYSIDESFLDLTGVAVADRAGHGREIRSTVGQWIGIPTCVGIGPTKTIAKLANRAAKSMPGMDGVCDLMNESDRDRAMRATPLRAVWGIGRAQSERLSGMGMTTAADLRDMPTKAARSAMGVVGERLVMELNGISCLPLETVEPDRKGIAVTRSFGKPVVEFEHMREAIAAYATRAAEKLRRHRMGAIAGQVFMHTNRHNGDPWCHRGASFAFAGPTDDTVALVGAATRAAAVAWVRGARFAKAGILLTELGSPSTASSDLFAEPADPRRASLMAALDGLNGRFGRGTLVPAAVGLRQEWGLRSRMRSPAYTTDLDAIPVVRA